MLDCCVVVFLWRLRFLLRFRFSSFSFFFFSSTIIYLVTANTTLLWSIPLQPILHSYDLSRHSQYYIAITYLVTANTTFLWSISSQPILHCYDLSRYSQYHIAITIFTLWHLIQQPIYLYTWSLSLCYNNWYNNLNYYYTTRIQQAFVCPYDTLDTTLISYILQLIQ